MGTVRHLEGVVRLPSAVLVAEDALGQAFTGDGGAGTFELTLPRLPDVATASEIHSLEPPYAVEGFVTDEIGRHAGGWGYSSNLKRFPGDRRRAVAWKINYLALKITDNEADDVVAFYDLADQFGRQFDAWYAIALDWTHLWSGAIPRDETRPPESRGLVRDVDEPSPDGLTGWGARLSAADVQFSESALDRNTLASAFAKAWASERPPTEWELFLRSQRVADRRIAVIEAATATEVALTRALDSRLRTLAPPARHIIAKQANGLVGLLTLLEKIDQVASTDRLVRRVADQLAGPRNDATHRGLPPTDANATARAFSTARTVLDHYSPLGRP